MAPTTALHDALSGVDKAWAWIAPHPGDPRRSARRAAQTRLGTGTLDHLEPVVELRSRPARMLGGWKSVIVDLTGGREREVGTLRVQVYTGGLRSFQGMTCVVDGEEAAFDVEGRFAVGDAEDFCTIATRGKPVAGRARDVVGPDGLRAMGGDLLSLGSAVLRQRDRFARTRVGRSVEERKARLEELAAARSEARRLADVVDGPVSAFDGWLTAEQHRTPVGQAVAEAWRLRVDRSRPPPAPAGHALVLAAAALCHRAAIGSPPDGLADLLVDT